MSAESPAAPPIARRVTLTKLQKIGHISLSESIRISFDTLLANKMRSLLTALGVIIGVAAVVALLAIGRGAQAKIAESITINGANLLTVRSGSLSSGGFSSGGGGNSRGLVMSDVAALENPANVPGALAVAPEVSSFGSIVAGPASTSSLVVGVTPVYQQVRNAALAEGEFISAGHVSSSANVVVLGSRAATALFGTASPVGRTLRIEGLQFRVIGVLRLKGGSAFGSLDDAVLVPLKTAQMKLFGTRDPVTGRPSVNAITVQARDAESIRSTAEAIAATLRAAHRLPSQGGADDFSIDNQQDLISTLTESQRTLTLYLGAIAAISLIVGGIGIMNIMLVSVRERTHEIGLRKAIGARERDILTQFLIEALTLSTLGGLLGLVLGVTVALVADRTGQSRAIIGLDSMVMALSFAVMVGLFFGIEPARRAARLDPIEALRAE
ncbi:MAG TPA: ABC transporter permease [Roseiflexaceae bacterium]|nr:ABC transporter permease [Roseiflexaceae bacterium]